MAKKTALTNNEFTALASVDGTPTQPQMPAETKSRLLGLYLGSKPNKSVEVRIGY
jgi:hypothetical protein